MAMAYYYFFEFIPLLLLLFLFQWWSVEASAFVVNGVIGADRVLMMQSSSCPPRRNMKVKAETENTHQDHGNTTRNKDDILTKHSRLCLAPMMEYTTRHFRAMTRLLSNNILTCTEMVAADELVTFRKNSDVKKQLLEQSAVVAEGPSVLQFGGNDPLQLYNSAKIYHEYSTQKSNNQCEYTALNLNCGCPSPSVSGKKCFGAALMRDANHVATLARAMHDGAEGTMPVTVKCRVGLYDENNNGIPFSRGLYNGISNEKEYQKLREFVETIASDGIVTNFQIHARIAVIGGSFSAADNRRVPPLKYHHVHRLTKDYPELNFVLNGGIHSLIQVKEQLDDNPSLSGIMVGRGLVADPWGFAMTDELLFDGNENNTATSSSSLCSNRRELLEAYGQHADYEERHNNPATIRRSIVAACAHLFAGEENSKEFRMELDEIAGRPERLEREVKAQVWSKAGSVGASSTLASAFSVSSSTSDVVTAASGWDDAVVGWDDMQTIEDNTRWDEGEQPLSELLLEAAHRHFADEVLNRSRKDSWEKKVWEEEEAKRKMATGDPLLSIVDMSNSDTDKKVSGGVVDGWFNNGLN